MTNDGSGFWNDDRVAELRRRWARGESQGYIADAMRVNRNTIAGKLSRLDLHGEGPIRRPKPKLVPLPRKAPPVRPIPQAARMAPLPEIDDQAIPHAQRLTLMQLEDHHCRWPIDGSLAERYFFCGATKVDESSYCAAHKRRARGAGTPSERQASR